MKRILSALTAGLIFGIGIAISGMGNPAKVLNFFDVLGTWDPSLAFVMGGALATAMVGYRVVFDRQQAPSFDTNSIFQRRARLTPNWLAVRPCSALVGALLDSAPVAPFPHWDLRRGRPRCF